MRLTQCLKLLAQHWPTAIAKVDFEGRDVVVTPPLIMKKDPKVPYASADIGFWIDGKAEGLEFPNVTAPNGFSKREIENNEERLVDLIVERVQAAFLGLKEFAEGKKGTLREKP